MTVSKADQQEQIHLIRQSAAAIVPRADYLARIRALRFTKPGFEPAVWKQMVEQGWLGLLLEEAKGGSGLGMQEFCALCEELGAALVPEPLLAVATLVPLLPDRELQQVLSGELMILPAYREPASKDLNGSTILSGGRVSGLKYLVPFAGSADSYLVTTRNGLALVQREANGVVLNLSDTRDGGQLGHIVFDEAPAQALPGNFDIAFEQSALATAAYLLGAAQRLFDITLEYVKVRKQFGKAIGAFQVLQHRMVDLKIQLALSRAVLNECSALFGRSADSAARQSAVSRAKTRTSDTAMLVAKEATQFHGAMGITDEADAGLYSRKVLTLYNQYGTAAWHRARYFSLNRPLRAAASGR